MHEVLENGRKFLLDMAAVQGCQKALQRESSNEEKCNFDKRGRIL